MTRAASLPNMAARRSHREALALISQPDAEDYARLPKTGLSFPLHLPFERWLVIGQHLSSTTASLAWCLGDWMVYGESAFAGRYRQAIEQTSLDYQTLRNYAWVARRYPLSRRREGLSFAHHAEVTALPDHEQDFWLRKAETLGWSRNQLRREVRSSVTAREDGQPPRKENESAAADSASEGDSDATPENEVGWTEQRLELRFTSRQLERYRKAASRASVSIEAWVTRALDQAASDVAGP
jgi:hypothetical protein